MRDWLGGILAVVAFYNKVVYGSTKTWCKKDQCPDGWAVNSGINWLFKFWNEHHKNLCIFVTLTAKTANFIQWLKCFILQHLSFIYLLHFLSVLCFLSITQLLMENRRPSVWKGLLCTKDYVKDCLLFWYLVITGLWHTKTNFSWLFFSAGYRFFCDYMQRNHWKLISRPPCSYRGACQMCTQHSKPLAWPRGWQPLPWT